MLWQLPIPDETHEAGRIESKLADMLQHNWVRWGSALLRGGVPSGVRRGHSRGPASTSPAWRTTDGGPWGHVPSGATGYAIPTLVEYMQSNLAEAGAESA